MNRNYFFIFFALFIMAMSCSKNNSGEGTAALNIIHAEIDVPSLYAYFTFSDSAFYLQSSSISYASSMEYGVSAGINSLTLVSATDTTKHLFQSSFQLKSGGVYSLYLTGQFPEIDTLFMQDYISYHSDSVASVRFINLSPGSEPVSINIAGNDPTQTEFSFLGYKQISSFRNYPANGAVTNYNFEVRDQKTGNLLTTFSWNLNLFRSNTLVINGSEDPSSSTPIGVFQVNNF